MIKVGTQIRLYKQLRMAIYWTCKEKIGDTEYFCEWEDWRKQKEEEGKKKKGAGDVEIIDGQRHGRT